MINALMLRDIESQPEALSTGLAAFRSRAAAFDLDGTERVVITGSGDSYIAPLAVEALYRRWSPVPVVVTPGLDAGRYLDIGGGDLVVVVSVSGEVSRAIETAARAGASGGRVIGVTARTESSLAGASAHTLVLPAPIDRSIPHSRDYTATIVALATLLERLAGRTFAELDALPEVTAGMLPAALDDGKAMASPEGRTWFLGAGPDRATAMYGALKYWEAAGLEAWWDDLEEFGHGSQLMARPGDRAVLVAAGAGEPRAREMVDGLDRMGLEVILVGGASIGVEGHRRLPTATLGDWRWHPFVSCLPLQALTLWDAERRGLDVAVPLFGRSYAPTYDEVHVEWTRRSAVLPPEGER